MKSIRHKFLTAVIVSAISFSAMAQSDTHSVKAFKDIHKTQETDRHLEEEIKKKELLKTPSQIYADTTAATSKAIKKEKCRRKKKTNF